MVPGLEGALARDLPSHDQRVDVVGALVAVNGLGVAEEAAHKIAQDAWRREDV